MSLKVMAVVVAKDIIFLTKNVKYTLMLYTADYQQQGLSKRLYL